MSELKAALFMVYGDPKLCGKTTMLARAFPRACFIGVRSAIELVARKSCGFSPDWIVENVTTLPELVGFLLWFGGAEGLAVRKQRGTNEVVVDDFSHICSKSMVLWRDISGKDKYAPYNFLDAHLDRVSFLLRDLGLLCAVSAHKTSPNWSKDTPPVLISPGAPEVPSRNQLQAVPGYADFVAPVEPSSESLDPWWPRVLRVEKSVNPVWVSGDRNNVAWENTPANMREILLAAGGYNIPRMPGLEWQDDVASLVVESMKTGEPVLDVLVRIFAHYKDFAPPGSPRETMLQWACQDGIARYSLDQRRLGGVLGPLLAAAAKAKASAPPPPPPSTSTSTSQISNAPNQVPTSSPAPGGGVTPR